VVGEHIGQKVEVEASMTKHPIQKLLLKIYLLNVFIEHECYRVLVSDLNAQTDKQKVILEWDLSYSIC
jgi:hypothetical protein